MVRRDAENWLSHNNEIVILYGKQYSLKIYHTSSSTHTRPRLHILAVYVGSEEDLEDSPEMINIGRNNFLALDVMKQIGF